MWIVVDWHHTQLFGPFLTQEGVQDWLAMQGIHIGEYNDQEVSMQKIRPTNERLEEVGNHG